MATISSQEFFSKGPVKVVGNETTQKEPIAQEPTLRSKISSTLKESVSGLRTIKENVASGETSIPSAVLQTGGKIAETGLRTAGDVITSTPVVKDVVETIAKPVTQGIQATQTWLENNPTFQSVVTSDVADRIAKIIDSDPDIAQNAEAINNIANAVLAVKGTAQTLTKAKPIVTGAVKTVTETAPKVVEVGIDLVGSTAKGISTVTKELAQPLIKAPERLKTNIAEKQIEQAEIQALPTKQARNVVNEGVDIADARDIINLAKESKTPELRKLFSTVENFVAGNKKIDPIEVVGKPIVAKLKESEKLKNIVGKQLTDVSKNLGIVTKPELTNAVLLRLQQVPGMENITLKGNTLDFKNTTLASQLTKSDRATIQKAFEQATKWGDGEKAHKFRQELFEILGGKKKSLETMTATQEESLNAIRKGLADVLDTKNTQYKALNETYAKLAQPVSEMRKLMKGLAPDDPEDILNMSAGLLARRITSAAPSNANVRMILRSLDEVVPSDTLGRVESLQDFYNILNKYYDIAPRTGFQNLTKEAVDSSMVSKITGKVGEYLGKTDATRQKAFKEFIESTLEY